MSSGAVVSGIFGMNLSNKVKDLVLFRGKSHASFVVHNGFFFFCKDHQQIIIPASTAASLITYSTTSDSLELHHKYNWHERPNLLLVCSQFRSKLFSQLEEHSYAFFLVCSGIFIMMCGFFFGFYKRWVVYHHHYNKAIAGLRPAWPRVESLA